MPDDATIRGRASLVAGHLKLRAGDVKGARSGFEDARVRMPKAPDPHLGLAMIHMLNSDLDKAENALHEAQRNGFQPQQGGGQRPRAATFLHASPQLAPHR